MTAPALADLIGKKLEGTWTLTLTDTTDDGGAALIVGALEGFEIVYDAVRSNHLTASGRLDVSGDLNVGGSLEVAGGISSKFIGFSRYCTSHGTTNGPNVYCLDGEIFDTTDGYLDVNTNGTITVLQDGYYRIEWFVWWRHPCTAAKSDHEIQLNGTNIMEADVETEVNREDTIQLVEEREFVAGDVIVVRGDPNCGTATSYGYHYGPTLSRLDMQFLGK
jgi:hypothetical protein